jgi:hypothetical protein
MALQSAEVEDLEVGDRIALECTGLQPTSKGNPRIDFKIHIDRDSAQPEQSQKSRGLKFRRVNFAN